MIRNAIITVLLVAVVGLADRLVRTENQRYALLLDSCVLPGPVHLPDFGCLDKVQTRTSWLWHLYYGLVDGLPAVPFSSH